MIDERDLYDLERKVRDLESALHDLTKQLVVTTRRTADSVTVLWERVEKLENERNKQ